MDRHTIIFSGASHTFGLGLEWELDLDLNNEEYLKKGINIPIPRLPHYEKYWKENRWPTLVCNELGYIQHNVHDLENKIKIGGSSVETIWMLIRDEDKIQKLFASTKYVILEIGNDVRWYDEELHGGKDGYMYPNTIIEMIDVINNPNSDRSVVSRTLKWINEIDPNAYTIEINNKIEYLIKKYPEIKFLILPWHVDNRNSIIKSKELNNNIIELNENGVNYTSVSSFLQINKLQVWHKAKAFNGNYEYNHREDHASVEGHKRVANMVINYIKNLEAKTFTKTLI
jgi:hypothetical protein